MGEAPLPSSSATGSQPACRSLRQNLGFRRGAARDWVLVWTSTERGEGRSLAGLSLVLAPGAPALGGGVLSAAAPRTLGGAGDDTTTRSTSSRMAVGSRLHVERKA